MDGLRYTDSKSLEERINQLRIILEAHYIREMELIGALEYLEDKLLHWDETNQTMLDMFDDIDGGEE